MTTARPANPVGVKVDGWTAVVEVGPELVRKRFRSEPLGASSVAPDLGRQLVRGRWREVAALHAVPGQRKPTVIETTTSDCDEITEIVMTRLPGRHLEADIRGRVLSPGDVVAIAHAVADTLATVHAAGWVHGDLGPRNVLVQSDGADWCVSVCDFGAAMPIGAAAATDYPMGHHRYLACESFRPTRSAAHPGSDLHQLGCLVLHALTGAEPFRACCAGESYDEYLESLADWASTNAPHRVASSLRCHIVPDPLVDLVTRCLSPDADLRPTAAETASVLMSLGGPLLADGIA
jgi:serine/threonine protein kinase